MSKNILIAASIVVASILFFSYKAGDVGVQFTGDENFYYESSKNMVETGDWLTPRYYGKPRFQKPFLYYWFVASSFKAFGTGWLAARLPSILLAAFVVLFVYLIALEMLNNPRTALLSAAILATTFKFFKYARTNIPDMALLFFITASIYVLIRIVKGSGRRGALWAIFFAILALATLTKGPIGVLIPVFLIISYRIFTGHPIPMTKKDLGIGILLYLAIVLPWFLIMFGIHGAGYMSHIWSREIAHRVGHYPEAKEGGVFFLVNYFKGVIFYTGVIFVRFLPWSVFLPTALFDSFRKARLEKDGEGWYPLLLKWFFIVFILFTLFGEKHSQYMLVLTPPFALMVGSSLSGWAGNNKKKFLALIALIIITASSFLLFISNDDLKLNSAVIGAFASNIKAHGLEENDRLGMGSHELIPQHLEVYLNRPVEKLGGKWYDPKEHEHTNKMRINGFFEPGQKGYMIIGKDDYERFVSPGTKKRLKILDKGYLWKRKIRINKDDLKTLSKEGIGAFLQNYKEEYYLVTNK